MNTFKHICPACGAVLTCYEYLRGKTIVCPNCDRRISVPESEKGMSVQDKSCNQKLKKPKKTEKGMSVQDKNRNQKLKKPKRTEKGMSVQDKSRNSLCIPAKIMIVLGCLHIAGGLLGMLLHPALCYTALLSIHCFLTAWVFQKLYEITEFQKNQIDLQKEQLCLFQDFLGK